MKTTFKDGYTKAKHLYENGFTLTDLLDLLDEEEEISCCRWLEWTEGFRAFIEEVMEGDYV